MSPTPTGAPFRRADHVRAVAGTFRRRPSGPSSRPFTLTEGRPRRSRPHRPPSWWTSPPAERARRRASGRPRPAPPCPSPGSARRPGWKSCAANDAGTPGPSSTTSTRTPPGREPARIPTWARACRRALSSRGPTMRSSRASGTPATGPVSGPVTVIRTSGRVVAARAASRRSTDTTSLVPGAAHALPRASSSSVSQMVRMDLAASDRASCVARVSSADRGRDRHQSSSAMIRARGLRSSCDSSRVSCRSWRSRARMRSRSASSDPPSRASSSGRSMPPNRSSEATALHCVAWSVMARTGRRARPTARRVST